MLIISAYKVPLYAYIAYVGRLDDQGHHDQLSKERLGHAVAQHHPEVGANVFETTKNCVDLKMAAPKIPTMTTRLGFLSSRRRLKVNVESNSDSDEATVIHEKSIAVYDSSRRKK